MVVHQAHQVVIPLEEHVQEGQVVIIYRHKTVYILPSCNGGTAVAGGSSGGTNEITLIIVASYYTVSYNNDLPSLVAP